MKHMHDASATSRPHTVPGPFSLFGDAREGTGIVKNTRFVCRWCVISKFRNFFAEDSELPDVFSLLSRCGCAESLVGLTIFGFHGFVACILVKQAGKQPIPQAQDHTTSDTLIQSLIRQGSAVSSSLA